MSITRSTAAQALGMKPREIIGIERVGDGYVVTTHDRQRTAINRHGEVVARGDVLDATGQVPPADTDQEPGRASASPDGDDTPAPELKAADVPTGSIPDVLAWVNEPADQFARAERAQLAQAVEATRDTPRVSLADALEKIRVDALGPRD